MKIRGCPRQAEMRKAEVEQHTIEVRFPRFLYHLGEVAKVPVNEPESPFVARLPQQSRCTGFGGEVGIDRDHPRCAGARSSNRPV